MAVRITARPLFVPVYVGGGILQPPGRAASVFFEAFADKIVHHSQLGGGFSIRIYVNLARRFCSQAFSGYRAMKV